MYTNVLVMRCTKRQERIRDFGPGFAKFNSRMRNKASVSVGCFDQFGFGICLESWAPGGHYPGFVTDTGTGASRLIRKLIPSEYPPI